MEKIKGLLLMVLIYTFSTTAMAQKDVTKEMGPVMRDGYRLMCLIQAAGRVTLKYEHLRPNIAGHLCMLPYEEGNHFKVIIFLWDAAMPVVGMATMDQTLDPNTISAYYSTRRDFTPQEKVLVDMVRQTARAATADPDFKPMKNTRINTIPIVTEQYRRCYMLSVDNSQENLIFGHDYVAEFDSKFNMVKHGLLHKGAETLNVYDQYRNILPNKMYFHYHQQEDAKLGLVTDIATVFLYNPIIKWSFFAIQNGNMVDLFDLRDFGILRYSKADYDKLLKK